MIKHHDDHGSHDFLWVYHDWTSSLKAESKGSHHCICHQHHHRCHHQNHDDDHHNDNDDDDHHHNDGKAPVL